MLVAVVRDIRVLWLAYNNAANVFISIIPGKTTVCYLLIGAYTHSNIIAARGSG